MPQEFVASLFVFFSGKSIAQIDIYRYNKHGDFMEDNKIISPELEDMVEEKMENSLRPKTLEEYIGQDKVKNNMKIYIEAAKKREEALDHVLLYGPPGLRKNNSF